MRARLVFFIALSAFALVLTSCKDDNNDPTPCGATWGADLQDEINALSNALTAYSQNPTTANCEAYKQAYLDYLDELKGWGDCVTAGTQQHAEWQEAIEQAEDDVNSIVC